MSKPKLVITKDVRYFETRRGIGYEATTDFGQIWNDGNGGGTYFVPNENGQEFRSLSEDDLENVINVYEGQPLI